MTPCFCKGYNISIKRRHGGLKKNFWYVRQLPYGLTTDANMWPDLLPRKKFIWSLKKKVAPVIKRCYALYTSNKDLGGLQGKTRIQVSKVSYHSWHFSKQTLCLIIPHPSNFCLWYLPKDGLNLDYRCFLNWVIWHYLYGDIKYK